jgi:hypothetical protein
MRRLLVPSRSTAFGSIPEKPLVKSPVKPAWPALSLFGQDQELPLFKPEETEPEGASRIRGGLQKICEAVLAEPER